MGIRKRPVETILVNLAAQNNLFNTASAGIALSDSDGTINLASGQLGVFDFSGQGSVAINTALAAGQSFVESPIIQICQGTPSVSTPSTAAYDGLHARTYETSGPIIGRNITSIRYKAYVAPEASAWVIGATPAATDDINPEDLTEYEITVALRGDRTQRFRSTSSGTRTVRGKYVTPDYTALGTTSSQDDLVQNLVADINSQSAIIPTSKGRMPVVAFAVDISGGSGVLISDLDNTAGGVDTGYGFSTTVAMGRAFANIAADSNNDIVTTSTVVPINLATAGSAVNADCIIVMSLPEDVAYEDRIVNRFTRLDVGLTAGFATTVGLYNASGGVEEQGSSREWEIIYKSTFGQRQYSQNRSEFPIINVASYLVSGTTYDSFVIEHNSASQVSSGQVSVSPKYCYLVVPSANTTAVSAIRSFLTQYVQSNFTV